MKENIAFNQIVDQVDNAPAAKLSNRTVLNQINKARTNFKHFGLEPKDQDARKFRRDLEAFFPITFREFFGVNFEDISLVDLIGHRRTENFLHEAEALIEKENYSKAVRACAVAFALYRLKTSHSEHRNFNLNPFRRSISQEIKMTLDDLRKVLESQQEQLDILMDGINPIDFRRFERLTPQVDFSKALTFHLNYLPGHRITHEREDALFCLRFALDAILLMKSIDIPPRLSQTPHKENFRIVKKTPAIVWPDADVVEVIRDVEKGELFVGTYRDRNYIHITLDGDPAYIQADAAEELPGDESPSKIKDADT